MKKNTVGALLLTLIVGAATAIGCGGNGTYVIDTVSSICDDICSCSRCTSNDLRACEDDADTMWSAASEAGCSDQFLDVIDCVSANLVCVQGEAVTVGCDAEQTALDICATGFDPFQPSLCALSEDALDAKYAACGLQLRPATSPSICTDALGLTYDCVTTCYEEASCAYLECDAGDTAACDSVSPEEASAFADCILSCP